MARKNVPSSTTEKKIFPARLRQIMDETGTTQTMLGDHLNVKRQTISTYTTGQSSPNWEQIVEIAKYFDTSADWLLGLTDVRSLDTDKHAVCKYTGLLEHAVDLLHAITKSESEIDVSRSYTLSFMTSFLLYYEIDFHLISSIYDYLFLPYTDVNNTEVTRHYLTKDNRIMTVSSKEFDVISSDSVTFDDKINALPDDYFTGLPHNLVDIAYLSLIEESLKDFRKHLIDPSGEKKLFV